MSVRLRLWRRQPAGATPWSLGWLMAGLLSVWAQPLPEAASSTQQLQQLSLEELMALKVQTVYAATKREESVAQAPADVSVLSQQDIRQYGYRSLGELLSSVRGFYVNYNRLYRVGGLRGVNRSGDYGDGMLLLLNGHRLNDAALGAANMGNDFLLDLDLIERVEVVRGPGSALYGDNAFFSVINVISRRGRDLQGFEASASAGSWDTYSGRLSYGQLFTNGVELLISGTYLNSQGHEALFYPEFSSVNGGWAQGLDQDRVGKLFGSLSYGELTLEAGFNRQVKSVPTAAYGTLFNEGPNQLDDQRAYGELRWQHELQREWNLQARGSFDQLESEVLQPLGAELFELPGRVLHDHDQVVARWAGGELQASKTLFEKHQVLLGIEGRSAFQVEEKNFLESPALVLAQAQGSFYTFGLYGQDEFALCTNLVLSAGARYDYYSTFGETLNPRAGIVYQAWEPTTFKLLFGQAFRAPNAYEMAYAAPGYLPNTHLKPEQVRSYELMWVERLSKGLELTTALFYNEIQNGIVQADEHGVENPATGGWSFRNLGETTVRGGEVELAGQSESGLRGRLSYSYSDGRNERTESWLANSPHHLAKFNLSLPLYEQKVFAGLELQATSRRLTAAGTASTPGFVLANLSLYSRELLKGLEASASLYNLLDWHYSDPASLDFSERFIPQDGRSFRVKLTYRF